MQLIELRQRLADNFGDPINHVLQLMNTLSQANKAEKIVLDYKDAKFTSPFYLSLHTKKRKENHHVYFRN